MHHQSPGLHSQWAWRPAIRWTSHRGCDCSSTAMVGHAAAPNSRSVPRCESSVLSHDGKPGFRDATKVWRRAAGWVRHLSIGAARFVAITAIDGANAEMYRQGRSRL